VIHTVKGFGIVNKAEIDVFSGTLLLGEISIISDMQMTPPLWQKVKRN